MQLNKLKKAVGVFLSSFLSLFVFSQSQKTSWKGRLSLNIEKSISKEFSFDLNDPTGSFVVLIVVHKSSDNIFEIDGDIPTNYNNQIRSILNRVGKSNTIKIKEDFVLPITFIPESRTNDPQMTIMESSRLISAVSKLEHYKKLLVKPIVILGERGIIKDL